MVFEFESDDDGEVVVTPLRPRGAVPTPKQISGQSSDGNDPLTDDRLSPADRSGADDTEEEEDEEGSSEPEDVLVGIAQERSPATALCRKRAGVKPRGRDDEMRWEQEAASQNSAVDGPSILDPLETTASTVRVPGKRGRKPGAATMTKTPPHVTKTSPHVTKTPTSAVPPIRGEVTPQQPEPIVVKRKRAMETPLSEDSRVFESPVPAGGVSEDVRPPQQGSIQGEFSDTESPLAGVSSCKVETVESLGKDTPTTGGVSVESVEVQPKATPTGEVPDTPTKVALQKESHGEDSHPMEASSGPYGTSAESCDAPAGPGDSTPDLRVKPEDFAPGSVPVMAGSVASRSDVMETDCAGAKGVSSASVRGSNIRQCGVQSSLLPPSEYPGGGEAEEDGEERNMATPRQRKSWMRMGRRRKWK
eukprot:Em0148g1a